MAFDEQAASPASEARIGQRKSRGSESVLRGRPSAVDDEAATAANTASTVDDGRVAGMITCRGDNEDGEDAEDAEGEEGGEEGGRRET